jgi:Nucleotidyl transferase AbiEii toxin, Type IV TA system
VDCREVELLNPKLEILPSSQRLLWEELRHTPRDFVLYGGTAIALRLGHRQSEDFDFFSNEPFEPSVLLDRVPYLKDARVDQRGDNTLTSVVDRGGLVRVSFFGDLRMSHVREPDVTPGNELQIASLLDLTATKLKTIQQRAEAKDYRDIAAALDAGVDLREALAAAAAVYGKTFNAIAALKALAYFEDGNLPSLPPDLRDRLRKVSAQVKPESLPVIAGKSGIARERRER